MVGDRTEFKPFGVESRARPYRLAFLVDPEACPPELLDSLFEANYELWGGRFNPIVPVCKGEIDEAFWSLLRYVDPVRRLTRNASAASRRLNAKSSVCIVMHLCDCILRVALISSKRFVIIRRDNRWDSRDQNPWTLNC